MLGEERQATSRKWMYTLAAVLVLVALGGSGLYYKTTDDKQIALDQVARATEAANAAKLEAAKKLAMVEEQNQNNKRELVKAIGISPAEVVSKWGNSTVWIDVQWRLYDRETLKPLFQKAFYLESGEKLPAYIKVGPGKIVRWLTTDDEERKNYSIGAAARGTGFVISKDGFILTNKHVAAGWMINFNQFSPYEEGRGVIVDIQRQPLKKEQTPKVFDLSPQLADFKDLLKWQPDEGGMIFQSRQPIPIQDSDRAFTGKNEVLAVRFPASRSSINADLVRPSTDADIALIKISTPQPLTAVELANDDHVVLGGAITVLGYPGASAETIAVIKTTEAGDLHSRVEQVPEPTVTPGNISRLSRGLEQIGSLTVMGTMGETYQLTASASAGNSGGPVFDSDGKVIAVFTYGSRRETMTLAVPIHYGKDLSAVQQ